MINYIAGIIKGVMSLTEGMMVTLKHLFKKPITLQYPEEKEEMKLRFRGRLVLPVDPEKGGHRCTACMICVKACPNYSIQIEKVMEEGRPKPKAASYKYNLGSCIFCNLCVESCPFVAVVMSDEHETATPDKAALNLELVAEKHILKGPKLQWWQSKFKTEGENNG